MANSVDPDPTAVCPGLSVRKIRIIMVLRQSTFFAILKIPVCFTNIAVLEKNDKILERKAVFFKRWLLFIYWRLERYLNMLHLFCSYFHQFGIKNNMQLFPLSNSPHLNSEAEEKHHMQKEQIRPKSYVYCNHTDPP